MYSQGKKLLQVRSFWVPVNIGKVLRFLKFWSYKWSYLQKFFDLTVRSVPSWYCDCWKNFNLKYPVQSRKRIFQIMIFFFENKSETNKKSEHFKKRLKWFKSTSDTSMTVLWLITVPFNLYNRMSYFFSFIRCFNVWEKITPVRICVFKF